MTRLLTFRNSSFVSHWLEPYWALRGNASCLIRQLAPQRIRLVRYVNHEPTQLPVEAVEADSHAFHAGTCQSPCRQVAPLVLLSLVGVAARFESSIRRTQIASNHRVWQKPPRRHAASLHVWRFDG